MVLLNIAGWGETGKSFRVVPCVRTCVRAVLGLVRFQANRRSCPFPFPFYPAGLSLFPFAAPAFPFSLATPPSPQSCYPTSVGFIGIYITSGWPMGELGLAWGGRVPPTPPSLGETGGNQKGPAWPLAPPPPPTTLVPPFPPSQVAF